MPVSSDNKALIAFKNLLNKSNTASNRELGNEGSYTLNSSDYGWPGDSYSYSVGFDFFVSSSTIATQNIPSSASTAVSNGIAESVTVDFVAIVGTNREGWQAVLPAGYSGSLGSPGDPVTNVIPPSFGLDYELTLYDTESDSIPVADSRDWVFQYQTGILWQETPPSNSNDDPGSGDLYLYTGQTLSEVNFDGTDVSIDSSTAQDGYVLAYIEDSSSASWQAVDITTLASSVEELGDLSNVVDSSSTGDILYKSSTGWENTSAISVDPGTQVTVTPSALFSNVIGIGSGVSTSSLLYGSKTSHLYSYGININLNTSNTGSNPKYGGYIKLSNSNSATGSNIFDFGLHTVAESQRSASFSASSYTYGLEAVGYSGSSSTSHTGGGTWYTYGISTSASTPGTSSSSDTAYFYGIKSKGIDQTNWTNSTSWAGMFEGDVQLHSDYKLILEGNDTTKGDSYLTYNSSNSEIEIYVNATAEMYLGSSYTSLNSLRLLDSAGGEYAGIQAAGTTTTYTVTMPASTGTASQILYISSGGGTTTPGLSWGDISDISGTLSDLSAGTGLTYSSGGPYDGSAAATIALSTPVDVSNGGTGTSSLTDHGILVGSGIATITALSVLSTGSLLLGSTGADPAELVIGGANTVLNSNGTTASWGTVPNAALTNSSFDIAAESGTTNAINLGETLTINGDGGSISTAVSGNVITISSSAGTGSMDHWYLRDGDGTTVTVGQSIYVQFLEGNSTIDIDLTDTSTGSTADPFDVTFSVLKVPNALSAGTSLTYSIGTDFDGSAASTISVVTANLTGVAGGGIEIASGGTGAVLVDTSIKLNINVLDGTPSIERADEIAFNDATSNITHKDTVANLLGLVEASDITDMVLNDLTNVTDSSSAYDTLFASSAGNWASTSALQINPSGYVNIASGNEFRLYGSDYLYFNYGSAQNAYITSSDGNDLTIYGGSGTVNIYGQNATYTLGSATFDWNAGASGNVMDLDGNYLYIKTDQGIRLHDTLAGAGGYIDIIASSTSNWVFTLPTNSGNSGQALITNGSGTTSWQDVSTVESINDLSDVDTSGLEDGMFLQYQIDTGGSGFWRTVDIMLDDLIDVNVSSASANDFMYFDGSDWVPVVWEQEEPTSIDNDDYYTSYSPIQSISAGNVPGMLVFLNGVLVLGGTGNDYTVSTYTTGVQITFDSGLGVTTSDTIQVAYWRAR